MERRIMVGMPDSRRKLLGWFKELNAPITLEVDLSRGHYLTGPWTDTEVSTFATNYCPGLRMLGPEDFR